MSDQPTPNEGVFRAALATLEGDLHPSTDAAHYARHLAAAAPHVADVEGAVAFCKEQQAARSNLGVGFRAPGPPPAPPTVLDEAVARYKAAQRPSFGLTPGVAADPRQATAAALQGLSDPTAAPPSLADSLARYQAAREAAAQNPLDGMNRFGFGLGPKAR